MTEFVDVNGLGGGLSLGFVQAGMKMVHRTGTLDLGAPVIEGNRSVIGWDWTSNFGGDYRDWPRFETPVIGGTPPCSAWSTLTRKDLRGSNAAVMVHTQAVIDYACLVSPELIVIESVQQAFSTGRSWYQAARDQLLEKTGVEYELIWVMQSNASVGGASTRKRVFVVFSRIPFGVEYVQPDRVARLGDAIRDLQGMSITMSKQPYRLPATWWSLNRRAEDGVDGHYVSDKLSGPYGDLWMKLHDMGDSWKPGQSTTSALQRIYAHDADGVPLPWSKSLDKQVLRQFDQGMNQTQMWDPEKPSPVVTGRGPHHSAHWAEPRLLTYRECARIQGFPDTWRLWPARDYTHLSAIWGKGVPVDAGRWIGKWCKAAVDKQPGYVQGQPIGPHERQIDVTKAYKETLKYERPWEHQTFVPHEHGHWDDREV